MNSHLFFHTNAHWLLCIAIENESAIALELG